MLGLAGFRWRCGLIARRGEALRVLLLGGEGSGWNDYGGIRIRHSAVIFSGIVFFKARSKHAGNTNNFLIYIQQTAVDSGINKFQHLTNPPEQKEHPLKHVWFYPVFYLFEERSTLKMVVIEVVFFGRAEKREFITCRIISWHQ